MVARRAFSKLLRVPVESAFADSSLKCFKCAVAKSIHFLFFEGNNRLRRDVRLEQPAVSRAAGSGLGLAEHGWSRVRNHHRESVVDVQVVRSAQWPPS